MVFMKSESQFSPEELNEHTGWENIPTAIVMQGRCWMFLQAGSSATLLPVQ